MIPDAPRRSIVDGLCGALARLGPRIALVGLTTLWAPEARGQSPQEAVGALLAADERAGQGDLDEAERLYLQALVKAPQWWPAYAVVAEFYAARMRDCASAAPLFDTYIDHVVQPASNHFDTVNAALNCNVKLERWDRALALTEILREASRRASDHAGARSMLRRRAEIALQAGRPQEALGALERVLFDDYGDVRAHVLRARARFALGRHEEALHDFLFVRVTFGRVAFINLEIGVVLVILNRYAEAVDALRRSIHDDGEAPETYRWLAHAHQELGQAFEAERSWRRCLELLGGDDSPLAQTVKNNLAWLIALKSRPGDPALLEALELSRGVVEATDGQDPTYCDTLAEILLRLGRLDEALGWIRRAQRLEPANPHYGSQLERFERYSAGFKAGGGRILLERWRAP